MARSESDAEMHSLRKVGKSYNLTHVTYKKVKHLRLKDENILAAGMICMALGILIGRFLHFEYMGFSITDFVEGLLIGLSLVMNITYLYRKRRK